MFLKKLNIKLLYDQWLSEIWYIDTKECYSTLKRQEILQDANMNEL